MSEDCVFCQITQGRITTNFEYQSENVVALPDINPKATIHLLIIPKKHITEFAAMGADEKPIWDEMMIAAHQLIEKHNLKNQGYRLVVNGGGAALVDHLHLHLLGEITSEREV